MKSREKKKIGFNHQPPNKTTEDSMQNSEQHNKFNAEFRTTQEIQSRIRRYLI